MSVRISVLGISFLTLISLFSLVFILTKVDPYNAEYLIFVLFYLSFFIAVFGLFTLAGFYLRKLLVKNKITARLFKTSFKQGILISVILTALLFLWRLIK